MNSSLFENFLGWDRSAKATKIAILINHISINNLQDSVDVWMKLSIVTSRTYD
jgi:hypothetical protein